MCDSVVYFLSETIFYSNMTNPSEMANLGPQTFTIELFENTKFCFTKEKQSKSIELKKDMDLRTHLRMCGILLEDKGF